MGTEEAKIMSGITALILAAGFGSRIADVTLNPKSLLPINGKTLMDWHFESLAKVGIKDVVVVTGYKRELLEDYLGKYKSNFNLEFAVNDDYKVKGNTYSLFFGLDKIETDFLLFDADLIYETEILRAFVEDEKSNQILVGEEKNISKNWEHVMNDFLHTHDMGIHQSVSNVWVEIDNREDYERAQLLFKDH